jgi:hypothetical protein
MRAIHPAYCGAAPRDGLSVFSRSLNMPLNSGKKFVVGGYGPASDVRKLILRVDDNQGFHGLSYE